jgi:hypothetical protein
LETAEKRESARDDARDIVLEVWRSVDWQSVSAGRRKGIYDEFASKIQSAAMTSDIHLFAERLARKMGLRSFKGTTIDAILKRCDPAGTLDVLRNETSLIVVMMRVFQEENSLSQRLDDIGYSGAQGRNA